MKSKLLFVLLLFVLPVTAQVIPDYSAVALGLSNDVISTDEKTYVYYHGQNTYELEKKLHQVFDNGRLVTEETESLGLIKYKTRTEFTYNAQGNIAKEKETSITDYSTKDIITDYFYEKGQLVKITTQTSSGELLTAQVSYQNGKPYKIVKTDSENAVVTETVFTDYKNSKNYIRQITYYDSDGEFLTSSKETYQNGYVVRSEIEALYDNNSTYTYLYNANNDLFQLKEADEIVEYNIYDVNSKNHWIKKKTDEEDVLMGDVISYTFRKIKYKDSTTGSEEKDEDFIKKYPPSLENTASDDVLSNAATGCQGNCADGYGVYQYEDGAVYTGFFKDNLRNGVGFYSYNDGGNYGGEWVNDKKDGYGLYSWADGSVYYGFFKGEQFDGLGVFLNKEGTLSGVEYNNGTYKQSFALTENNQSQGCVAGNCQDGFGKYVFDQGGIFVGFFKNAQLTYGNMVYENGDSYIGGVANNKKHGFGIYIWPDGSLFMGYYQNDVYQGQGYFIDKANNTSLIGLFNNGSLEKDMTK